MLTPDDVRRVALSLPEVQESSSYGTASFKIRRKLFARLRDEDTVLVVRIDLADKDHLIGMRPDIYFSTPHYDGYPAVLVKLDAIDEGEMRRLLAASWRMIAPPTLSKRHPAP